MFSFLKALIYPAIYTLITNYNTHNEIASRNQWNDTYDFIVIGAGTAGSVVARRLSDNSSVTVLILEAGRNEDLITDIPALIGMKFRSLDDWGYITEPQKNCFINYDGQRARWPRGKILGGSSALNGMVYMRGHPKDFDNWEKLGCKGWSYNENLPYFKRSEMNTDTEILSNGLHGDSGPIPVVTPINIDDPSTEYLITAAEELGFKKTDLNGIDTDMCANIVQQHILNGTRFTASKAFLESVFRDRKNLHILTQSFVTKILFSFRRAKSVEFRRNGKTYRVSANKEIILSAGTINSPQILMLSGIGPAKDLLEKGIPLVANVPGVGQNLHDQTGVFGNCFEVNSTGPNIFSDISIEQYLTNLTGPLAHVDVMEMIMTSNFSTDRKWPDMAIMNIVQGALPSNDRTGQIFNNFYNLKIDVHQKLYKNYFGAQGFCILSIVGRPKSRGFIKLKSSDHYEYPIIQPNYLTHPDDVKVLIDAYRWQFYLASTDVFKRNNVTIFKNLVPGCEGLYKGIKELKNGIILPSNEYMECVVRHMTSPEWHYVGTCKMGPNNDPMTVVSPKLVVRNVYGLRVIDASIMPTVTLANTNAPTLMIAERGAQFIKDDYKLN